MSMKKNPASHRYVVRIGEYIPYIGTFKLWTFKDVNLCFIIIRHEWNCSLPFIFYCWRSFSSTKSHTFSLLHSVTLLVCPLDANPFMPVVLLLFNHWVVYDSFVTLMDWAHQTFPRKEYWSGLPFPSPGDLPDPGIKGASPALMGRFFTIEPPGKPNVVLYYYTFPGK